MNPAFAFAPLRLSLSASRGASRHVLSLLIPPPQRLVREGGGIVKVHFRVLISSTPSRWAPPLDQGAFPNEISSGNRLPDDIGQTRAWPVKVYRVSLV